MESLIIKFFTQNVLYISGDTHGRMGRGASFKIVGHSTDSGPGSFPPPHYNQENHDFLDSLQEDADLAEARNYANWRGKRKRTFFLLKVLFGLLVLIGALYMGFLLFAYLWIQIQYALKLPI
ncbi:MAG: hypothetical protein NTU80_11020 [Verrucomicrobia bacterium]|nr:hypothetical protein [Verrucomicrobiota bacterium]